jgi:hypothetical protein
MGPRNLHPYSIEFRCLAVLGWVYIGGHVRTKGCKAVDMSSECVEWFNAKCCDEMG